MKSKLPENGLWRIGKRQLLFCLLIAGMVIRVQASPNFFISGKHVFTGPVTGRVTGDNGTPIAGVNVVVKGSGRGAVTDNEGRFRLSNVDAGDTLLFSSIGYATQTVPVRRRTVINVQLLSASAALGDVVVVGYGVQKKITVTGAISSMKTDEVVQAPQANLSNYLAGRLPGVLAQQPNGQPGGDQSVIAIRGIGSFSSGASSPLVMVDGIEALNWDNIDPNEIETVSVLKDASSTAVYGIRGANGVLLITTKRGKTGKPKVSFTNNVTNTQFANLRRGLGSYDYARTYDIAQQYDSYITGNYTPLFSAEDIALYKSGTDPIFHPNTDWTNLILKKNALQYQTNLNISGGSDRVKYFISGGYFNQSGLFNNTDVNSAYNVQQVYRRYNFRSNFDFTISRDLSATVNLSSQLEQQDGPFNTIGYVMLAIFAAPPTVSPGIVDGKIIDLAPGAPNPNPFDRLLGNGYTRVFKNNLDGSVRLNYKLDYITPGLSAHGTFSYHSFDAQSNNYNKTLITYRPVQTPNGLVYIPSGPDNPTTWSQSVAKLRKDYAEAGLDYARKFGDHSFSALVLYNQSKVYDPTLAYMIPHAYQGIVGRVTYDYKSRYLAEFDAGYNGTENFAPGKRFGFFPAYSLGWVVSEEPLFPKNNTVTFLKLRGSDGEVGNDLIGGQRFLYRPSSYVYTGGYFFGNQSSYNYYGGSMEGQVGNPIVTWERARKIDVGMDLRFWRDRISVTADWFTETRNNILANPGTVPSYVGAILPAENLGRMRNSGYDGSITYRDKAGKLSWFAGVNFTYAHNKILFMDEAKWPYAYETRTGHRLGQFFGLISQGFYNTWSEVNDAKRPVSSWNNNKIMPGDVKYKDVNGDGIINSDDQVPIGYSNFPEQVYGFNFGGTYGNFDLSVFFQGAAHVSLKPSKKSIEGWQERGVAADYLLNESWSPENYAAGKAVRFPHYSADAVSQGNNYQPSTLWLENAAYLRLKTVELGYTLKSGFLRRANISSAHFYVSGNNLLTFSHVLPGENPESGSQDDGGNEPYPVTRSFNLGLNITF